MIDCSKREYSVSTIRRFPLNIYLFYFIFFLFQHIHSGNKKITELLLKNGAIVDMRDKNNNTALLYSLLNGNFSVKMNLVCARNVNNVKIL